MTKRRSRKRNKSSPQVLSSPKKYKQNKSEHTPELEPDTFQEESVDSAVSEPKSDSEITIPMASGTIMDLSTDPNQGQHPLSFVQSTPVSAVTGGFHGQFMGQPPLMDPAVLSSQLHMPNMPSPQQLLTFAAPVQHTSMSEQDILKVKALLREEIDQAVEARVAQETDSLKKELTDIKGKYNDLMSKYDDLEQYSRRSCLRLSGIPENQNEDVTKLVLDFSRRIGANVSPSDIDRAHRVGKRRTNDDDEGEIDDVAQPQTQPGHRPSRVREIIIKFTNSDSRLRSLQGRAKLRAERAKVFINEDLTASRKTLAFECRGLKRGEKIKKTWIYAGSVYILDLADKKSRVTCLSDLDKFKENQESV